MPPTDAILFYRWMWLCYAAGRSDALGERTLDMEPDDAAIVNIVRADWRLRMGGKDENGKLKDETGPDPFSSLLSDFSFPPPPWLAALQEAHTPEPWES